MRTPPHRHHPLGPAHIDAPHRWFEAGDLVLESGEVIRDCAVGYVTHGELNARRDNAVLLLSAIGATHHRLDFMIGPDRAFDPGRYFAIAVDAIGNGMSSSPSTSRAQPGSEFPRFTIRDMVASQIRLVREGLGIERLRAVCGASMGGMQALQWAVSQPDAMDVVIAMTPMARTAPWAALVNEACRSALMADPAWTGRAFQEVPARGWRVWAAIMRGIASRTPAGIGDQADNAAAVTGWVDRLQAEALASELDPLDWIYQSWAYDDHDVGKSPGYDGDMEKALGAIRARTLIMAPPLDVYNPVEAARYAAKHIPGARFLEIPSVFGHQAAAGVSPADADLLNKATKAFIEAQAA